MAKRKHYRGGSAKARMAWVRSHRKKGHKKNPFPIGGLVVNPKHRRRSSRGRHSYAVVQGNRRRRHRRFRSNPSVLGLQLPPMQPILYAGVGFAGTVALETVVLPLLPDTISTSILGKYAVRIGSVIGVSYLAKAMLGKDRAKYVAIGGGAYVLISAVKEFLPGVIPGLSAYVPYRTINGGMGRYTGLAQGHRPELPAVFGQNVRALTPGGGGLGANGMRQSRFNRF